MSVGEIVGGSEGSGVGLPMVYVGTAVGGRVGDADGAFDGMGVGLPAEYVGEDVDGRGVGLPIV